MTATNADTPNIPEVRDRERPAAELGRGDVAVADRCRQPPGLLRDPAEVPLVGVGDRRDEQRLLGRYRHADVDVLVQVEGVAGEAGVHLGVLAQRERARLDDHVVDGGRTGPGALGVRAHGMAHLRGRVHVHRHRDRELGNGALGLRHALGDPQLHPGGRDQLGPLALDWTRRRRG